MQLIDELRAEHDLIEQVVGSLRTFVDQRQAGQGEAADGQSFLRFFRLFAGHFHHAREEDTLVIALTRDAELPADRGPIAVMLADHARTAAMLDAMEPLIGTALRGEAERARLQELTTAYAHALWHHIDAENTVLLPESEVRLKRHGVAELPSRPMTAEEREARAIGEALLERYPPASDADAFRGDGCIACPAFGETCRGLEHEWWNEWEWEEFEDHLPSG